MRCFPVSGGGRTPHGLFFTPFRRFAWLEASLCFRPTFPISFLIFVLHFIFGFPLFFCPSNLNSNAFRKISLSSLLKTWPYHLTPLAFAILSIVSSNSSTSISSSVFFLSIIFTPHIKVHTQLLDLRCRWRLVQKRVSQSLVDKRGKAILPA